MSEDSGGHWKDLDEARKLTESTKIPGVFATDIKRNNPAERLPVVQASGTGKSLKWLREKNFSEDAVLDLDIGDQLTWDDDVEYDEVETYLKRLGIQRKLDNFVKEVYSTYNNYRAQALLETEKKVIRRIGDRIIYGDLTYGASGQWDGLHAYAAERSTPWAGSGTNSKLNMDMASAGLSLQYVRTMEDALPLGVDEIWTPFEILRWLDAAYEEKGFVGLKYDTAGNLGFLQRTLNDLGKRVMSWNGIPFARTDYLMGETTGTGTGATSDARTKLATSSAEYSMFFVLKGNVMDEEPGVCFAYGATEGAGDLYKFTPFEKLEDYDGEGMRLVTYGAVLLGSYLALGRIADIADAAVTV